VSLFSGDVEPSAYPPDLETWSGANTFSWSQLFDVTRILPSGNRSTVKVTLSEVASFSITRFSGKGPSYPNISGCGRSHAGAGRREARAKPGTQSGTKSQTGLG